MFLKKIITVSAILTSFPMLAVECPKELTLKLKAEKKKEMLVSQENYSRLIKNEVALLKSLKSIVNNGDGVIKVVQGLRESTDRLNTLEADLALSKRELKDWEQCPVLSEANLKAQAIAELKVARDTYLNQVCNGHSDSTATNIFDPFSLSLKKIQERYSHLDNIGSLIQEYNPMSIVVKETRPTTNWGGLHPSEGVVINISQDKVMLEKGIYPVTMTQRVVIGSARYYFSNPAVTLTNYLIYEERYTLAQVKETLAKTGNVQLELASPEECLLVQIPTVENSVAPSISTNKDHPSISDSTEVKDLPKKGAKPSSSSSSGATKQ